MVISDTHWLTSALPCNVSCCILLAWSRRGGPEWSGARAGACALSGHAACAAKKAADKAAAEKARKEGEGKTPCARCAKKKADDAKAAAAAKAKYDWDHPCEVCNKDKKDKEEKTVPLAVNATHQAVPVTEEIEKEVIVKDEKTGKNETVKAKIPVTKTKIVPKVAPVA